jgi:hypothetical protein
MGPRAFAARDTEAGREFPVEGLPNPADTELPAFLRRTVSMR